MSVGFIVINTNENKRVTFANPAAKRITGADTADKVLEVLEG